MNHTKQFIEDAIAGGLKPSQVELKHWEITASALHPVDYHRLVSYVFLDPLAWQAVGRARGWTKAFENGAHPAWKDYWHYFIDHLADGHDIEEALAAITSSV